MRKDTAYFIGGPWDGKKHEKFEVTDSVIVPVIADSVPKGISEKSLTFARYTFRPITFGDMSYITLYILEEMDEVTAFNLLLAKYSSKESDNGKK